MRQEYCELDSLRGVRGGSFRPTVLIVICQIKSKRDMVSIIASKQMRKVDDSNQESQDGTRGVECESVTNLPDPGAKRRQSPANPIRRQNFKMAETRKFWKTNKRQMNAVHCC